MVQYLQAIIDAYMPGEKSEGQGLVEYALILVLISVVAIAIMATVGGEVRNVFQGVVDALTGGGTSTTT